MKKIRSKARAKARTREVPGPGTGTRPGAKEGPGHSKSSIANKILRADWPVSEAMQNREIQKASHQKQGRGRARGKQQQQQEQQEVFLQSWESGLRKLQHCLFFEFQ